MRNKGLFLQLGSMLLILLLAGCGSGTAASTSATYSQLSHQPMGTGANNSAGSSAQKTLASTNNAQTNNGPQYLVKSLNVTIAMKDPQKAADALQSWISTTDPRSTSAGVNYTQAGNNTYNITLSFSVQTSLYPQIQHYLQNYAQQQKGQLVGFQETVQDVTTGYIDTQSQLKNLRGEQARLLDLLHNAQTLNDTLAIEQKLTDVEGKIETLEEQSNNLNHQLAYYTVTINIQPLDGTLPVQPAPQGWSFGQTFHDAFAASFAFAQAVATFLIWLLAYSIYIIPIAIIAWFIRRWRKRIQVSTPTPKA